jgi:hypothetical protein
VVSENGGELHFLWDLTKRANEFALKSESAGLILGK